ncbi:glycosyltransferase family 4 protein [Nocardioides limicola]|uniref:glycosyltransferase family 4 protein n=1 Tax=Nocardioides limicola TaxID=2803368 RepID=UPI00193C64DB|nr:glycosyltransferase family 4 protein [Nocardioides sp. DJM-14]
MISFIWEPGLPLPAGTGGSENYTIGQVRELNRRGLAARVVTIGLGVADGRDEFVGIPFLALATVAEVSELDGAIVFVTEFPAVATRTPAYQILHVPPPLREHLRDAAVAGTRDRGLIATSGFAAQLWSGFLDVDVATIQVVYPFAEPCFASQPRWDRVSGGIRILYAGRLSPEKGIYTFLAMLHNDLVAKDPRLTFTATTSGDDKPQGALIRGLLEAHPGVDLVPACKTPAAMAALMAEHDIVVMPSNSQYWHETFGIVSIEAQHAGCRVVASDDGGLPETDCGAVILVQPDNAEALALGIREAIALGPLSPTGRHNAGGNFTVAQSVDELLAVLARPRPITPAAVIAELEALVNEPPREKVPAGLRSEAVA